METSNVVFMEKFENKSCDEIYITSDLDKFATDKYNKDNLTFNNCTVCGEKCPEGKDVPSKEYYKCRNCSNSSEKTKKEEASNVVYLEKFENKSSDEIYITSDLDKIEANIDNKDNLTFNNCTVCGAKCPEGKDGLSKEYYMCRNCSNGSEKAKKEEASNVVYLEKFENKNCDEIYITSDLDKIEADIDNKDNLTSNNCIVCGEKCPEENDLLSKEYYICRNCSNSSEKAKKDEGNYVHIVDLAGRKMFTCRLCEKNFSRKSSLNRHYRYHAGRKFSCPFCSKHYNQVGCLNRHIVEHTGVKEPLTCEICNKKFGRKSSLTRHLRLHTGDIKPEYSCDVCDKLFKTKAHLKRHCLTHTGEKPYMCDVCNKRFITSSKLKEHYRLHTGDAFTCPECQKEFCSSTKLKIHIQTHSGIKPFFCTECGKSYAKKSSLDTHTRTIHVKLKYTCEICNAGFSTPYSLSDHYSLHTGKPLPFCCQKCNMRFRSQELLKKHENIHKKIRPYKCEKCGKRFIRKAHLKRHDNFHERPFSCHLCSDSFSQKLILEKHIRTHKNTEEN